MIHHKKVCQYTFEKKLYYLVHSKSNIRGNVCQTYLMYVSIPMFFPDDCYAWILGRSNKDHPKPNTHARPMPSPPSPTGPLKVKVIVRC